MAIYLTTGAPGAGKTLFTLQKVEQRRQKEDRTVYFSGISGLTLPWVEFEKPEQWDDLPIGSIIVIDESQRFLRPRFAGSKVPDYVEHFETHRHKGYDIYLITQHPLLIDANVRRLIESHEHIMRKFGSSYVTVHQWKGVKENCDKTRADSITTSMTYPREVFTWYKSAELHTHKTSIPFKVKLFMFGIPALFISAAYFYYQKVHIPSQGKPPSTPSSPQSSHASTNSLDVSSNYKSQVQPLSASEWLKQFSPRVAGLPHTAPRYDELTIAKRVPTIRGCWLTDKPLDGFDHRAVCMLDGAVFVYPPESFVRQYLRDRFFIDWENPRAGDMAAATPRAGDVSTAGRPVLLDASNPFK